MNINDIFSKIDQSKLKLNDSDISKIKDNLKNLSEDKINNALSEFGGIEGIKNNSDEILRTLKQNPKSKEFIENLLNKKE